MKALVIYDLTGKIWNIVYGEEAAPQGLTCMFVDIPDGAQLERIDVTDPDNPQPVFTYLPDSDIGKLQKQVAILEETLEQELNPTIDTETCTLDELKDWQVEGSKAALASYLQMNPLVSTCHGGKEGTYTITEEKMNLFTSKYTAHVTLVSAGVADQMTWNESGQPCELWTDEECIQLISEWNAITTPLVSYQQEAEIRIMNAASKDDVLAVDFDYSKADPRIAGEVPEDETVS